MLPVTPQSGAPRRFGGGEEKEEELPSHRLGTLLGHEDLRRGHPVTGRAAVKRPRPVTAPPPPPPGNRTVTAERGSRCARETVSKRCRPSAAPTSSAVTSPPPASGTGKNPGLPGNKNPARGFWGGTGLGCRQSSPCSWRSRAGEKPQQHAVPSAASSAAAMGSALPPVPGKPRPMGERGRERAERSP